MTVKLSLLSPFVSDLDSRKALVFFNFEAYFGYQYQSEQILCCSLWGLVCRLSSPLIHLMLLAVNNIKKGSFESLLWKKFVKLNGWKRAYFSLS